MQIRGLALLMELNVIMAYGHSKIKQGKERWKRKTEVPDGRCHESCYINCPLL